MTENRSSSETPQQEESGSTSARHRSSTHRKATRKETLMAAPPASGIGVHADPTKPPRKVNQALTTKRMVTIGMLFPLFIMVMMPLVMTGMTHHLTPHHMKVAVIGSEEQMKQTAEDLDKQTAGSFDVSRVDSVNQAENDIRDHTLRAAYNPASGDMYFAGANGPQVKSAVTNLFSSTAQQSKTSLTSHDIQPASSDDNLANIAVYLALGAVLGGFMAGMILGMVPVSTTLRLILGLVMPAIVAFGEIFYGWGMFGIFDSSAVAPWFMFYLLGLSCLAVTSGGMLVIGPAMMPLSMLLMPFLGMSASGINGPLDMINGFYGGVNPWLFSAQGIEAVRDAAYFPDVSLAQPVWVMIAWTVGGILLAVLGTLRQKRRHLFAQMNEVQEATSLIPAVAVAP
ncbi:ABC transporter permease [Rothia uropygialis]|uniref:ABC transporter permease n=1 Tax=Kocuria sp. 36 TaxID=1415402 RepID=UPI00101C2009|nr:ABC transporter permease [Kocuria sp. 36]